MSMPILKAQLTVPMWLSLPHEMRRKLAKTFNLKMSSGVVTQQVMGKTTVLCDGHTNEDLSAITSEVLFEFVGDTVETKDFWALFEAAVEKLGIPQVPQEEQKPEEPKMEPAKKRGRPKKVKIGSV